jgi:hypothetical protein
MATKWLALAYNAEHSDCEGGLGLSQLDDNQYSDLEDPDAEHDVADLDVAMAPVEERHGLSEGPKVKSKRSHFKTVLKFIDDAVSFH